MMDNLRIVTWITCVCLVISSGWVTAEESVIDVDQRVRGMLIGSLLGDAAGGPPEFKSAEDLKKWLPDLRSWSSGRFEDALKSDELMKEFRLLPYLGIRSDIAPYGPWERDAAAGTVTDDSRHKMVMLNCLRNSLSNSERRVSQESLAQAYLDYAGTHLTRGRLDYEKLTTESFKEYTAVANWILGERDLSKALPPQRLWAGISTCSGQMTLLPLAGLYPGDADAAYRAAFAIDFVDVGPAKDINAALVAGLAAAIGSSAKPADKWQEVFGAIRDTDPYRYGDVPFAKRPATEWLDFALHAADRAEGSPNELFRILETEGRAKYFWDAHFTFASAIAFLKLSDYQPLAAITVSLAFGHDTDSAAQVIGALAGAIHGPNVFPEAARKQVENRLLVDYEESIDEWVNVCRRLRERGDSVVEFIELKK